ncbi:hypothetical protein BCR36DRAFT_584530 [Piromyces finnis]|uniref:Nucleotide-diphospho-sugar transferase n=1 Tax=Piromyces finnis TaxID=1754191 RepID=A0A1Y1V5H9_9FUNG|nr:hypothetical protein BCR36DRAFT_584530 [Piromyces finnis]|eukprot:ORX47818.1 hypothetical protein BCR36DRAFT_584530 [Piromyces finnis]
MVKVNAFVTLLTSETYIQGVIALAHSLQLTNTENDIVCMVTKDINSSIIKKLEKLFDKVIYIDEYNSKLGSTYGKLNVWKLVQYNYIIYLDADTIVLKNIDSLFDQMKHVHNQEVNTVFIAVPNVDSQNHFNSGVFACRPDLQTFLDLVNYSKSLDNFDDGDKVLFNNFFSQWINNSDTRLSFKYITAPSTYHTYVPEYQKHKNDIKIIHFTGNNKPWLSDTSQKIKKKKSLLVSQFDSFVDLWWNIYDNSIIRNGQISEPINSKTLNYPYDNSNTIQQKDIIKDYDTNENKKNNHIDHMENTIENNVNTLNNNAFGNYSINWNSEELRGFGKQCKRCIDETGKKAKNSVKFDNTINSIIKEEELISQYESEIENSKIKDDILNISCLPGLNATEETEGVLHESSFKTISKEFDIYAFNYQDDIKRKSFINEFDEDDVKISNKKRKKSLIETMKVLDDFSMTNIESQDNGISDSIIDRSMKIEDTLDVTGIIEDNFENDLFINEDEIENISFVKNRGPITNGNKSFASYNDIEKYSINVEPISFTEVTEVLGSENDIILPNDLSIKEGETIINESIIPSEFEEERDITIKNLEISNEIINAINKKYNITETEISKLPDFYNSIIKVNNVEIPSQHVTPELDTYLDRELMKQNKDKKLSKDNNAIIEKSLSLEELTLVNNTFSNKSILMEGKENLREEDETEYQRKVKDQIKTESVNKILKVKNICNKNFEEDFHDNTDLDSLIDDIEISLRRIINENTIIEEKINILPKENVHEDISLKEEINIIPREVTNDNTKSLQKNINLEDISTIPLTKEKESNINKINKIHVSDSSISIKISESEEDDKNLVNHITILRKSLNDNIDNTNDIKTSIITTRKPASSTIDDDQKIIEMKKNIISVEMEKTGNSVEEKYKILIENDNTETEEENDCTILKSQDSNHRNENMETHKKVKVSEEKEEIILYDSNNNGHYSYETIDEIQEEKKSKKVNLDKKNENINGIQEEMGSEEKVFLDNKDENTEDEEITLNSENESIESINEEKNSEDEEITVNSENESIENLQEIGSEEEIILGNKDKNIEFIQEENSLEQKEITLYDDDGPYTYEIIDVIQEEKEETEEEEVTLDNKDKNIEFIQEENCLEQKEITLYDDDGPYTYEIIDVIQEEEEEITLDNKDENLDIIQEKNDLAQKEITFNNNNDDDGPYFYEIIDVIQEVEPDLEEDEIILNKDINIEIIQEEKEETNSEKEIILDIKDENIKDLREENDLAQKQITLYDDDDDDDDNGPYTFEIIDVIQEETDSEKAATFDDKDENVDVVQEENSLEQKETTLYKNDEGPYTYEIIDVIQEEKAATFDDKDENTNIIQNENGTKQKEVTLYDDDGSYTYEIIDILQEEEVNLKEYKDKNENLYFNFDGYERNLIPNDKTFKIIIENVIRKINENNCIEEEKEIIEYEMDEITEQNKSIKLIEIEFRKKETLTVKIIKISKYNKRNNNYDEEEDIEEEEEEEEEEIIEYETIVEQEEIEKDHGNNDETRVSIQNSNEHYQNCNENPIHETETNTKKKDLLGLKEFGNHKRDKIIELNKANQLNEAMIQKSKEDDTADIDTTINIIESSSNDEENTFYDDSTSYNLEESTDDQDDHY